jgi:hypothetical protein
MATSLQISRQFQRELHAHQEGKTRLQEATRRAEERSYASSSVYGKVLKIAKAAVKSLNNGEQLPEIIGVPSGRPKGRPRVAAA